MRTKRSLARALVAGAALALLAVGCSDSEDTNAGSSGSAIPNYLPIAQKGATEAMAGRNRKVDTKARPAVAGKTLGIVETSDAIVSVGFPAQAAKTAAE